MCYILLRFLSRSPYGEKFFYFAPIRRDCRRRPRRPSSGARVAQRHRLDAPARHGHDPDRARSQPGRRSRWSAAARVACRRLELLLAGGAERIAVFSDAPSAALAELAGASPAPPPAGRGRARALCACSGSPTCRSPRPRRSRARARAGGVLVNVEDVIGWCDFHNPSIVRRGDLLLTVSTGGQSPGLAARIRAPAGASASAPNGRCGSSGSAPGARPGGAARGRSPSSRG